MACVRAFVKTRKISEGLKWITSKNKKAFTYKADLTALSMNL